jgi:hypothetical protein
MRDCASTTPPAASPITATNSAAAPFKEYALLTIWGSFT